MTRLDPETGAMTIFSELPVTPWQCASNAYYDFDRDGVIAPIYGGDDCDDFDAEVGACP